MNELREKLKIPEKALHSLNNFILDENNPLINSLLQIIEKYGGIDEINNKAKEASNLDIIFGKLGKKNPDYVKNLDNNSLTIMAGVLNDIKSKYISEDAFKNLGSGSGSQENSKEGLRKQGQELMLSKEYTDAFSPRHEEVKAEVAKIYEQISKLG